MDLHAAQQQLYDAAMAEMELYNPPTSFTEYDSDSDPYPELRRLRDLPSAPDLRPRTPPNLTIETVPSLQQKLANRSTARGTPKAAGDYSSITQAIVDDWNEFMLLSARYHSLGEGEQARLAAYMGDINKEFMRSIKGSAPQTPAPSFQKDFRALGLTPATDWDEYYFESACLAAAVRHNLAKTMRFREMAMQQPCATRMRDAGYFADREWQTHENQVQGYFSAWTAAERKEAVIQKCAGMWAEEKAMHDQDPQKYKWKDPEKMFQTQILSKDGEHKHVRISRRLDPREATEKEPYEDEEFQALVAKVREEMRERRENPVSVPELPDPWSPLAPDH